MNISRSKKEEERIWDVSICTMDITDTTVGGFCNYYFLFDYSDNKNNNITCCIYSSSTKLSYTLLTHKKNIFKLHSIVGIAFN